MSSWVKVTRGQPQKPVVNKKKPSGIPRLLDINPYKPSQKISFSELYPRDVEDQNSFEELFGKKHNYSTGPEEYCERYQFSENSTQYNSDDRREKLYLKFYQQIQDEYHKERPSDCTIVAISKEQMEYATAIGHRLQDHGLVVEMIYLTTETGLTRALQEVKNDGSPFCILVEQSNVALSSCTAIILHDSIKIHRNMPMEDALALVVKAFGKVFGEREQQERNEISHKAADLADDYLERELYESYTVPLDVRHLLFLLSDGKYLYAEELKAVSDYLKTRITELEGFEEADTTEQANPAFDSHTNSKTHLLEKPPPLLPTPARNSFGGMAKPSLLGDRPSAGIGLLSNQGFKNIELDDAANSIYKTLPSVSSDALAKPPPLLPTPVRTPLMSVGKPPLLSERSSGGLLPTPGLSAPQGKPPPLLAMPTKRPPLLGYPQISPAKRPLLGEKPGLLPTPALSGNNTSHLWPVKPKPLLQ
ncbi:nuclear receptor coactivator 5-like isoform X4 [Rana temporaria]|uniref:nuclear receptor coactivator 5-like isoform X4 n=1 Tax=Rana temporaria TaxID=8407 RepID=UPI001AAD65BA|nr:nuclear receptor coactivator 5-like isoform X4 [Rana temporaria]